ncbi:MAG: DUF4286 family protein [Flavobacteriaceae bacterium]|nr:DUF4286 family protein [Flavobacteriaceae bacterium]
MQIYNITFIVEPSIEQAWATHVDKELLPELAKNVQQIDLLRVELEEGIEPIDGSTFSMQFYCREAEQLTWVKEIGHPLVLQKLYRVFPKDWVAFASRLEFLKTYS